MGTGSRALEGTMIEGTYQGNTIQGREHTGFGFKSLLQGSRGENGLEAFDLINKIGSVFTPPFDIKETTDDYVVITDLPGLKEEDVDVEVCDGRLTIAGEREKELSGDGEFYYALDRHFGTFCLTFQLPTDVDGTKVHARLGDGVLTVNVPKAPRGPVKRVPVSRDH
jgi:HSP20 family protein